MDEDYELISKEVLNNLRAENKKLKKELEEKQEKNIKVDNSELISQVVEAIKEESKKEKNSIEENLHEIKELNKTTLDNLIAKTQNLDDRLETMINTISQLVTSLSEIISKLSEKEENIQKIPENNNSNNNLITQNPNDITIIQTLTEKVNYLSTVIDQKSNFDEELKNRLGEIEVFMKNLRILLSYVKPNDMKIQK